MWGSGLSANTASLAHLVLPGLSSQWTISIQQWIAAGSIQTQHTHHNGQLWAHSHLVPHIQAFLKTLLLIFLWLLSSDYRKPTNAQTSTSQMAPWMVCPWNLLWTVILLVSFSLTQFINSSILSSAIFWGSSDIAALLSVVHHFFQTSNNPPHSKFPHDRGTLPEG